MMHNIMRHWLSDPARISALTQAIRAKVPANDVEDVVQSTLADALVSVEPPTEEGAFDRWLFGIARHKIADYYRRNRRDVVVDSDTVATTGQTDPTPESARDLLRWVDQELPKEPEATRTLEWMMREASGDRLETIAQEHALSAPAVRQRVSRLRRYLRERWAMELAAALGLLLVVTGIFAYRYGRTQPPIGPDIAHVEPTPAARAQKIREAALSACKAGEWKPCLIELDRAKEQAKKEQAKKEQAKQEQAKKEQAKQEQAKQEQAKKEPARKYQASSGSKKDSKNVDIDLDEGPAQKYPAKFKK